MAKSDAATRAVNRNTQGKHEATTANIDLTTLHLSQVLIKAIPAE